MISDAAALVLFAIRSSIKLGQQMRQAYVDSTKNRELVLPLPNFFSEINIVSAANYFDVKGQAYLADRPKLAALLQKRKTAGKTLTAEEEAEVCTYHIEFENLDRAKRDGLGVGGDGSTLNARDLNALITIRQWQRGDNPNPSTLQRIAGTLVEIGVDYFGNVPGALDKSSRQGKAIGGFLDALHEIKFSEEKLGELPGRLFVAALETISENSELLSADAKVQELVKVTTKSVSTDVARRLDQLGGTDLVKAERVRDWAELVFRSVLSSAGGLVLSNPKRYLGIEQEGQAALVSRVGESVLGLVLDDSGVKLDRLLSRQGLEKITKTALAVVGEHPEILVKSKNAGLQKLLSAIATELSQFDTLLTPDLLPELTRLILEKTGENLALLWPDLENNPQKHLLLTAASTTLRILSRPPAANEKWKFQFSSADVLSVAGAVLDELAANPTWLLDQAGQVNDNLKLALDAALGVLRIRADARLSSATAVEVLRAVVMKVGLRKEFLEKLPNSAQPLVTAALDAIFKTIFDGQLQASAAWQVVRKETIVTIVNLSLNQLAKAKLSAEKVTAFAAFIKQQIDLLAAGGALDLPVLEAKLQTVLAAP
ncbi:MAG: hypothetical protein HY298_03830 [Verrucomicrobia bacterium]|nr:hypothetical protein [Verrucomicrobiota bacterium]